MWKGEKNKARKIERRKRKGLRKKKIKKLKKRKIYRRKTWELHYIVKRQLKGDKYGEKNRALSKDKGDQEVKKK